MIEQSHDSGVVRDGDAKAGGRLVRLLVLACSLSALAAALLAPSAASAAQAHHFTAAFGAPGAGAGQLALLFPEQRADHRPIAAGSGVAVDDESGDLYVGDTGNHRVSEFESDGHFVRAFGADVGGSGVDVCTATCVAGTPGSAPGQLQTPTFIGVDNATVSASRGDVYVADSADNVVSKFDAAGNLLTSWGVGGQLDGSAAEKGPFAQIEGIAVDPTGNLWVQAGEEVFEFTQAGIFVRNWNTTLGSQPAGTASDGAEHLYLLAGFPFGPIHRLSVGGSDEGVVFGPGPLGALPSTFFTGLGADQATHGLYADQEGKRVVALPASCQPVYGVGSECTPTQVFGESTLTEAAGLAIDSVTGTLYAADAGTDQIAAFTVGLEATTEAATDVEATAATLHGKVDPEGSEITRCQFEYGVSAEYGSVVPCVETSAQIGSGTAPVSVHADLSGLAGGTGYHFRLRTSRTPTDEEGNDVRSEDETLETLPLPTIDEATATDITAGSATLKARINPHGLDTRYRFEYGPCAGASNCPASPFPDSAPETPADIGQGSSDVSVSQLVEGLEPNVTYHFRVAATSTTNGTATSPEHTFVFLTASQVEGDCPNDALRQANASTALPDCRAYELVTPARKNGALIGALFLGQVAPQISTGGSAVVAPSIQCFAGAQGCVASRQNEGALFEFARSEDGWTADPLAPPASLFPTSAWWSFDVDSGAALYSAPNAAGGDDFQARARDGSFAEIGPIGEGGTTFNSVGALMVSTSDFSHILYPTAGPHWSFDEGASNEGSLYEYVGEDNAHPILVGVSGAQGSTDLISACSSYLGDPANNPASTYGSLSADGRTVYFTAGGCPSGSGLNATKLVPVDELFARIDGEGPDAHTVAISEPDALVPAPPDDACTSPECKGNTAATPAGEANWRDGNFEGASGDASRVFFTSTQQLTDQASQDPSRSDSATGCNTTTGANGCNLYLYDFGEPEGQRLTDVSTGAKESGGPRVQGVMAISPDGTHVYFVAKGVLTEADNAQGQAAVEGADNLYLYQRDAAQSQGHLTFITTLQPSDDSSQGQRQWTSGLGIDNTTPDGRYLVFTSHSGLTPDARPGEGPQQIYRYDAETQELMRISIGARGFNDDGNSDILWQNASGQAAIWEMNGNTIAGGGPVSPNPGTTWHAIALT